MKAKHLKIELGRICRLFGMTRQAYYQHFWRQADVCLENELIISEVKAIRRLHPAIGTRKLLVMIQPFLLEHQIKLGRDALFDLLSEHRLLIRKRKRSVKTTQSHHWLRKYPNLIQDFVLLQPNQLWVADITYYRVGQTFVYLSLLTDAYSHKIVGYQVGDSLETLNTLAALQMAIQQSLCPLDNLIHHSDRGVQYCSEMYVKILECNKIKISMTETGDPRDNAVAERINGILKEEYLNHYPFQHKDEIAQKLPEIIHLYNDQRPHLSCNMLTPTDVHENKLPIQKLWKKNTYCKSKKDIKR